MWRKGFAYEPARLAVAASRGLTNSAQTLQFRADALKKAGKKQSMKGLTAQEVTATT
jgi:hypothetical protein